MPAKFTNPLHARHLAEVDYDEFSTIVDEVSRKYDITDPDQFESAIEIWWAGNTLEEVIQVNPLMEVEAFYEVAGRCRQAIDHPQSVIPPLFSPLFPHTETS